MWRRSSGRLKSLAALWRSSTPSPHPHNLRRSLTSSPSTTSSHPTPLPLFSHQLPSASATDKNLKKKVEDILPIATGMSLRNSRLSLREETFSKLIIQLALLVPSLDDKEQPAIVKSVYDKRIVGCPGGEGDFLFKSIEDEHDVVWFWLEKNKPHECPVCSHSKWLALEVLLMVTEMTIITDPTCSFLAGLKYDGNAIFDYRLYREVNETGSKKKMKGKACLTPPATCFQWEKLASNLEEFHKIVDELQSKLVFLLLRNFMRQA
ncbi:hypothetical protein JRO89_XS03G0259900 [Xanthoceras sorbifolium]|uniref:Uncharacterized protein n=1 Tax=Xanthoceras sorbifolium TaxID=99658 RepID=A0ABQ8IBX6_9ROSI|nr:hypothetical protein JRO89_XS03G0259900 [Xanthoceras sorbifolium]